MYVRGVKSGVCGFYTTLHTEYCYSCRRCWRLYSVYSGLSPLPGGKAIVWAFGLGGLAVHHCSVQGVSWTCQLQGWLQARCTAKPQFLKLKGAQQPGNSYISMGTKLHPPYPNQDCLPVFWSKKCLQCLKNVGLYNSYGLVGSVFDKVGSHEQVD